MAVAIEVRSIEFRRISYQKFTTDDNRSNEREARCTSRLRTADRARITLCHCWHYREREECQIFLSSGIKFFFFFFRLVRSTHDSGPNLSPFYFRSWRISSRVYLESSLLSLFLTVECVISTPKVALTHYSRSYYTWSPYVDNAQATRVRVYITITPIFLFFPLALLSPFSFGSLAISPPPPRLNYFCCVGSNSGSSTRQPPTLYFSRPLSFLLLTFFPSHVLLVVVAALVPRLPRRRLRRR